MKQARRAGSGGACARLLASVCVALAAAMVFSPVAISAVAATDAGAPVPVSQTVVEGPSRVRIIERDGHYQLLVNDQPFYVKGAGLEFGNQEALVAHGGNSFRTWSAENGRQSGQAVLDRARANGLLVAMGLNMSAGRHGFDYGDPVAVAAQLARIKSEVQRYKDHPALLMWVPGNELNLGSHDPRVWDAVNQVAKLIHELDPNHPVMTALAGLDPELIANLKSRAPALDLIGIQLYADINQLAEKLRLSEWTGPYIVTEWGPTGHWEIAKTSWGAPIEDDSTRKADLLRERYQRYIAIDQRQCLGSYVFLWGNKQERTPTWYGLFLASGEATAGVDAMQFLWTGAWPRNRSPAITAIAIDSRSADQNITLSPGRVHVAQARANDNEKDALTYRWLVLEESAAQSAGGDHEETPSTIDVGVVDAGNGTIRFKAPSKAGAYRLFVYVFDGEGHAAHANIPFRVEN